MPILPEPVWPVIVLAVVMLGDVVLSLKPLQFIADCLSGVKLPREWWWVLIVIKLLAVAGLIAGLWVPGVALAANVGLVAYFLCAVVAHVRARFWGMALWVNCLGLLGLTIVVLLWSFVL